MSHICRINSTNCFAAYEYALARLRRQIDFAMKTSTAIVCRWIRSANVCTSGDKISARFPSTYKSHRRFRRARRTTSVRPAGSSSSSSNGDHLDSYSSPKFVQPRQIYCRSHSNTPHLGAVGRVRSERVCSHTLSRSAYYIIRVRFADSPLATTHHVYTTYVNLPRARLHISRA